MALLEKKVLVVYLPYKRTRTEEHTLIVVVADENTKKYSGVL